jgi:hypothetical protein
MELEELRNADHIAGQQAKLASAKAPILSMTYRVSKRALRDCINAGGVTRAIAGKAVEPRMACVAHSQRRMDVEGTMKEPPRGRCDGVGQAPSNNL